MLELNKRKVDDIKEWFFKYVNSFKNDDLELLRNIELKEKHSLKVCEEILAIASFLKLKESEFYLAEIIGLLHDVGRFKQYSEFRTFVDKKSVNHADLGVKILNEERVLSSLSDEVKNIIIKSVKYHNRIEPPDNETEECLFFIHLIRDADKLDIYRVVTEYYTEKNNGNVNKGIELDLPDLSCVSNEVCEQLLDKKPVSFENVKYLNDFKLLQLGWVFDVNFYFTYKSIKDRDYLKQIAKTITETEKVKTVIEFVMKYVEKKLRVPVIDFTKCKRCKKCIDVCPNNAISMSFNNCCAKCIKYCLTMEVPCHPKEIIFKYEKCDSCGLCVKTCPEDAIYWHETSKMIDDN